MNGRRLGARRDSHDVRDAMYRAGGNGELPQQVDLREWGGPVKDQGQEGSCTGHAFSSAREWIARRYEKAAVVLSPQFLYVEELRAEGAFPRDEGAMPRTGCRVLAAKGCCEAALYPYVEGKLARPTAEQEENGSKFRIGAYHRVGSVHDLVSCLGDAVPWPVTVGFGVYESFMTEQVAETGVMPVPGAGEERQGGHEVLCLGYDLGRGMGLMQNSWGEGWGQRGYFWMPFEVLAGAGNDLWMVHTGGVWK